MKAIHHLLLISVLYKSEWSVSRPFRFNPRKGPPSPKSLIENYVYSALQRNEDRKIKERKRTKRKNLRIRFAVMDGKRN
jgi:hypothetical protein